MKTRPNRRVIVLALLAQVLPCDTSHGQSASSISSNFNGTDIADTSFIWFNSHISSVSGVSDPVTLYFRNQRISLTSPSTGLSYSLSVPDAEIRIDSSNGSSSTVFAGDTWITTVDDGGNDPFLSGFVWDIPSGENPKAANPVTWSGEFYASQSGVSIQWQWSAATYTGFSTDHGSLGVTPIDGADASQSGTPLHFTSFVTGGARGGGGSNFTGSNSATGSVSHVSVIPEPSTAGLAVLASLACLGRRRR